MKSALFVAALMMMTILSGCFGESEEPKIDFIDQEEYSTPVAKLHFYSEGERQLLISSCDFAPFTTIEEPLYKPATTIIPFDAINPNLQFEIYEPLDLRGRIVIASVDLSYIGEMGGDTFSYDPWFLYFQQRGAAGLIFSKVTDWDGTYVEDCEDMNTGLSASDSNDYRLTSAEPLTIPIIQISPLMMELVLNLEAPYFVEAGPSGFTPTGWVDPSELSYSDSALAKKQVTVWEPEHPDCPNESAGALVTTISEDSNLDGSYDGNEIRLDISCMADNPYDSAIVSISSTVQQRSVPADVCASGREFRIDIITTYRNGDTSTSEGKNYVCEGINEEEFETQLKRSVCPNGKIMNQQQLDGFSVINCLTPTYEAELQRVTPQIKSESLTEEQMPFCERGGILITMWADSDGNGQWDQSETQSTQRICHGMNGKNGQDGTDGEDALNLVFRTQAAQTSSCPSGVGGNEVLLGRDRNGNDVLDDSEIEHSYATCNGADGEKGDDGTDGESGLSSIINVTSLSSPQCNGIYVRLSNGYDLDNDSLLSKNETSGARYICLPSQQTNTNATFVKELIDPNSHCLNGGIRTYIWLDENRNNVVDVSNNSSEIFMETIDCAPDEDVVECLDSDEDCISDEDDTDPESSRESNVVDSDGDTVPDLWDQCPDGDDREDSDFDGTPDHCDDDF